MLLDVYTSSLHPRNVSLVWKKLKNANKKNSLIDIIINTFAAVLLFSIIEITISNTIIHSYYIIIESTTWSDSWRYPLSDKIDGCLLLHHYYYIIYYIIILFIILLYYHYAQS